VTRLASRSARRDLFLLAAGQAVSVTGDSAALIALMLRVHPAGSGWVAALLAAELVPFVLCAPFSGRAVDRTESWRLLLAALLGQGLVTIPLALVSAPWTTVVCFAGLNAVATIVRPATSALVPAAVGQHDAARGYSRLATGTGLGWIVGPALGGLLAAVLGVTTTLLVDAATFALLALAVAFVRARRPPAHSDAGAQRAGAWEGFRLLWRSVVLRLAVLTSAVAIGCAVVDNVAAPFRFLDQLGVDGFGYGVYLSVWGVGSLIGVQIPPRLAVHRRAAGLAIGNLLTGLGILLIGLAPTYALALVASALGGIGNGMENVAQSALVAQYTPSAQHGRAFAALGATVQAAIGIGTAAGAPLVKALGANYAMVTAGAVAAAIACYGLGRSLLTASAAADVPAKSPASR
jgi:MFS family permease